MGGWEGGGERGWEGRGGKGEGGERMSGEGTKVGTCVPSIGTSTYSNHLAIATGSIS